MPNVHYTASDGATYSLGFDADPTPQAVQEAQQGLEAQLSQQRATAASQQAANAAAGRGESYLGSGVNSFVDALGNAVRGTGEYFKAPSLLRGAQQLEQGTSADFPVNPNYGSELPAKIIGTTGGLAGAALPFTIPYLGEVAGPASLLPQSYDAGYQAAEATGAPASTVRDYAGTNALVQLPLMVGLGKVAHGLLPGAGAAEATPLAQLGTGMAAAGAIGSSSRLADNALMGPTGYDLDPNRTLGDNVLGEGASMAAGAGLLGLPNLGLRYALSRATPATTTPPPGSPAAAVAAAAAPATAADPAAIPPPAADPVLSPEAVAAAAPTPPPAPVPTPADLAAQQPPFLAPLAGTSAAESAAAIANPETNLANLNAQLAQQEAEGAAQRARIEANNAAQPAAADKTVNYMDRLRAAVDAETARQASEQASKDAQVAGATQRAADTAAVADPVAPATAEALRQKAAATIVENSQATAAPEPIEIPPAPAAETPRPAPPPPAPEPAVATSGESAIPGDSPAKSAVVPPAQSALEEEPGTVPPIAIHPDAMAAAAGEPASPETPDPELPPRGSAEAGTLADAGTGGTAESAGAVGSESGPSAESTTPLENGQSIYMRRHSVPGADGEVTTLATYGPGVDDPSFAPDSRSFLPPTPEGQQLIGAAHFTPVGDGELMPAHVEVHPAFRRQGVASRLYSYAEDQTGRKMVPGEAQTEAGRALSGAYADRRTQDTPAAEQPDAPRLDDRGKPITVINSDPKEAMRQSGDVQASAETVDNLIGGVRPDDTVSEIGPRSESYGSRVNDDYFHLPQETPEYVQRVADTPPVPNEASMLEQAFKTIQKRRYEVETKVGGYDAAGGTDAVERVMSAALVKYQSNLRDGTSGQDGVYKPNEVGQVLNNVIRDFQKGASKRTFSNASLDAPMGEEGSASMGDAVADPRAANPADEVDSRQVQEIRDNYLRSLPSDAARARTVRVLDKVQDGVLPENLSDAENDIWEDLQNHAIEQFKQQQEASGPEGSARPSDSVPARPQTDAPTGNAGTGGREPGVGEHDAGQLGQGTSAGADESGEPAPEAAPDRPGEAEGEEPERPAARPGDRVMHGRRAAVVQSIDGDTARIQYKGRKGTTKVPTEDLKPPIRRQFSLPSTGTGADDIIDHIVQERGVLSKSAATARGMDTSGGEFDGAPDLKGVYNSKIFGGNQTPDQMAAVLHSDYGYDNGNGEFQSGDMWNEVQKALQSRASGKEEVARQATVEAQESRFKRDTSEQRGGDEPVPAKDLAVGDEVKVGGAPLKVVDVDPDGNVTLQDGRKYGRQEVTEHDTLYVEKWDKVPTSAGDDWMSDTPSEPSSEQPTARTSDEAKTPSSEPEAPVPLPRSAAEVDEPAGHSDQVAEDSSSETPPDSDRKAAGDGSETQPVESASADESTPAPRADGDLPKLREKENQGDLLSTQSEDLHLVGEKGIDYAARAAEQERQARESAEARAAQDRAQGSLLPEEPPPALKRGTMPAADDAHLDRALNGARGTLARLGVETRETDGEHAGGLGVRYDPATDRIVLDVDRTGLADNMARNPEIARDPAGRRAFIDKAMGEEVEHAADIAEAYDRWKKSGSTQSFSDFFHADKINLLNSINDDLQSLTGKNRDLANGALLDAWNLYYGDKNVPIVTPEEALKQAASGNLRFRFKNTADLMQFFHGNSDHVGPYMMETMRMLNQIRASNPGITTETAFGSMVAKVRAYVDQVLQRLRRVAANPDAFSPALADALRRVQTVRDGRPVADRDPIRAGPRGGPDIRAGVKPMRTATLPAGATPAMIRAQAESQIDSNAPKRGTIADSTLRGLRNDLGGIFGKTGQALRDIRNALAPASASPEARLAADTVRERSARLAASDYRGQIALDKVMKAFNALDLNSAAGRKTSADMQDRIERGLPQTVREFQPFADQMRALYNDRLQKIQALGTGMLDDFRVNYLAHIWKEPDAASAFYSDMIGKRPLEGPAHFAQQRTIDYQMDGIAQGLEPVSWNPAEMTLLKLHEMDRFLMAHDIANDLKGRGLASPVATEAQQGHWATLRSKLAAGNPLSQDEHNTGMMFQGADPNDRLPSEAAPGNVIVRVGGQQYDMPPDAARIINNFLAPGLRGKAVYDVIRNASGVLNQAQLGLSAFHAGFVMMDTTTSKAALGLTQIVNGIQRRDLGKAMQGVGNLAKAAIPLYAPIETYNRGNKLLQELGKPGSVGGQYTALADAFQKGGNRPAMESFYSTGALKNFKAAFAEGNYAGAAIRAPMAFMEAFSHPLMANIVPRVKAGVFADLAAEEMERLGPNPTPEDELAAYRKASDTVDNRLGQVVYDNLFWDKTLKDVAMLGVRSVGWNLGTIRELGGGALDANPLSILKRARAGDPLVTHQLAYAMALPMVAGVAGSMIHYLHTGQAPQDLKDALFPRTGRKNPDGSDERLATPSYIKDVKGYADHPVQTIVNKVNPLASALMEMYQNKDFFGSEIRNANDPLIQQIGQEMKFMLGTAKPFSLAGASRRQEKGALPTVESFFGVTPAPVNLSRTPAENAMVEAVQRQAPSGGKTPEEMQRMELRRSLMSGASAGQDIRPQIAEAVKSGSMTEIAAQRLLRDANTDPKLRMFRSLDIEDARRVFDLGTPAEKQLFITPLRAKEARAGLPLSALAAPR